MSADPRLPIAVAAGAGIERTRYTIREGPDTGTPGDDPKVCLATKARGQEALALVEPCIPALLAGGCMWSGAWTYTVRCGPTPSTTSGMARPGP